MSAPAQLLLAKARLTPQQKPHVAWNFSVAGSAGHLYSCWPVAVQDVSLRDFSQLSASEQVASAPSSTVRQAGQPPKQAFTSGQFVPKALLHKASGPHRPDSRDMARVGVLPQCG